MIIREVDVSDAGMIQAIYAPFVANTIISFEEIPPDISEMARRIAAIAPVYPYLVAEEDGQVFGYAPMPASTAPAQLIVFPST